MLSRKVRSEDIEERMGHHTMSLRAMVPSGNQLFPILSGICRAILFTMNLAPDGSSSSEPQNEHYDLYKPLTSGTQSTPRLSQAQRGSKSRLWL